MDKTAYVGFERDLCRIFIGRMLEYKCSVLKEEEAWNYAHRHAEGELT